MNVRMEARHEQCLGWRCLNAAQQFGIIFSIVVFFIVGSLLYMYAIGKAKISHENKHTQVFVGGVRVLRPATKPNSRSISRSGSKMISPANPPFTAINNHPLAYYTVPMLYRLNTIPPQIGPTVAQPTYPSIAANPNFVAPIPQLVPSFRQLNNADIANEQHQASSHEIANVRSNSQTRVPNWFQRLQTAFRLPTGRASTVATRSRSPSPTPRHEEKTGTSPVPNIPNPKVTWSDRDIGLHEVCKSVELLRTMLTAVDGNRERENTRLGIGPVSRGERVC